MVHRSRCVVFSKDGNRFGYLGYSSSYFLPISILCNGNRSDTHRNRFGYLGYLFFCFLTVSLGVAWWVHLLSYSSIHKRKNVTRTLCLISKKIRMQCLFFACLAASDVRSGNPTFGLYQILYLATASSGVMGIILASWSSKRQPTRRNKNVQGYFARKQTGA